MLRDIIYYKEKAEKYPAFVNGLLKLYVIYWIIYLFFRIFFITIKMHKSSDLHNKITQYIFNDSQTRVYFYKNNVLEYRNRFSIFKLNTVWILDDLHIFEFIDWINLHNLIFFSQKKSFDEDTITLLAFSVPWFGKSGNQLVADLESIMEESR